MIHVEAPPASARRGTSGRDPDDAGGRARPTMGDSLGVGPRWSRANRTASTRVSTPSFALRLATCTLAVLGAIPSSAPISGSVRPRASRSRTRRSRAVRSPYGPAIRAGPSAASARTAAASWSNSARRSMRRPARARSSPGDGARTSARAGRRCAGSAGVLDMTDPSEPLRVVQRAQALGGEERLRVGEHGEGRVQPARRTRAANPAAGPCRSSRRGLRQPPRRARRAASATASVVPVHRRNDTDPPPSAGGPAGLADVARGCGARELQLDPGT